MCNQKAIHLLCAVLLLGTISTASAAIVAYYPMDEGSGTAAKDASGKGHDATITGTVKWAESKPGLGTALDFPGDAATANYLGAGTWDPSESTGQVSVAAWIKWAGANSTSTFQGIVTKCDGVFVAIRWQLTMSNSTNGIGFGFGGGAPVYPAPAPPVGEWQHVTFTHDGTTATMYINGTAQTTTSTVALGTGTGAAIVIGALNFQGTADGPFKGTVDEVYIFDNALSATEVGQVMQGGFANPYKSRSPNPSKGATDVPRDTALSWSAGKDVISHDVYFGTVFDDVNTATRSAPAGVLLSQGQTATDFDPAGLLDFGQTYYWRVDEVNAPSAGGTIFKGDVWSFTAEPYSYPVTAPIQATASSSYSSGTEPNNTVNGSGLTGDQHSDMITDMWVSSKTGPQPPWIQYEFDRVLKLDQMWVWNSNQAIEEILGFGVREVTIEVSTDANTWTAIPNVPEFAQATGLDDYVYNTIVDLGGAVAKYVKLTCLSTWGGGTQC
ncbi:MAG: discoidin domain-containing protein, partial [Phycisphaerae bacterium]|nr:discoidin domain-containing protein [Phycisphaerae bacterium]